jgi:hypothetical protein
VGELAAELLDADDWSVIPILRIADHFVELCKLPNNRHCHANECCVEAKERILSRPFILQSQLKLAHMIVAVDSIGIIEECGQDGGALNLADIYIAV